MPLHIITASLMWLVLFVGRMAVMLLGIVVVPIGALTLREVDSDREHSWTDWRMKKMNKLFWLWDNDRDGSMGDTRGNYNDHQRPGFIRNSSYLKAVYWLAIRNPANNWSRFMHPNSVDVRDLEIEKLAGDSIVTKGAKKAWQLTIGRGKTFNYYGFYILTPAKDGHWNIRLGHKIMEKHIGKDYSGDPQKAIKGFTIRVLLDRV